MSETAAKHSSQGPFFLWHGCTIAKIVRLFAMRPPVDVSRAAKISLLPFTATWNSIWTGLESLVYSSRIRDTKVERPPIFVLGFWRSGTTLLHNLITSDPQFTFANYYQC